ncbi:type II toxin-antitoxin system VapB family antitoxin [Dyadobacter fanqingshengii]|uniref:DUF2281 domain-containing protein n=1 Tax=Dyadobacter fanqingshengii TaxID=2906443 RepID=A0A9X1T7Q0_9BACT|nr:DUF2281 domain-containing protein [Dyadobacter fanqingshengii]MCF0039320.1 DUF2281 domain-containing protein [Dyadobacter fanqingshengii]MCF2503138.1 DUF2281 domain-containing protein [Dyadobacter fanqingshengii]USJ33864.1 DUF2281 domain-containing protein [Dyadobacter fanqingshengii]
MTDLKLYTKLSKLPVQQKAQVVNFIEDLEKKSPSASGYKTKRLPGKAKGLIVMKDNFDDDIEGFNAYAK